MQDVADYTCSSWELNPGTQPPPWFQEGGGAIRPKAIGLTVQGFISI